jgi:hypothetical protein
MIFIEDIFKKCLQYQEPVCCHRAGSSLGRRNQSIYPPARPAQIREQVGTKDLTESANQTWMVKKDEKRDQAWTRYQAGTSNQAGQEDPVEKKKQALAPHRELLDHHFPCLPRVNPRNMCNLRHRFVLKV